MLPESPSTEALILALRVCWTAQGRIDDISAGWGWLVHLSCLILVMISRGKQRKRERERRKWVYSYSKVVRRMFWWLPVRVQQSLSMSTRLCTSHSLPCRSLACLPPETSSPSSVSSSFPWSVRYSFGLSFMLLRRRNHEKRCKVSAKERKKERRLKNCRKTPPLPPTYLLFSSSHPLFLSSFDSLSLFTPPAPGCMTIPHPPQSLPPSCIKKGESLALIWKQV